MDFRASFSAKYAVILANSNIRISQNIFAILFFEPELVPSPSIVVRFICRITQRSFTLLRTHTQHVRFFVT